MLQTTDEHPLTRETFRAVFSAHERGGRWEPADEIQVRVVFGQITLDFTRAELSPSGVVDLEVRAVFGAVKIIVPDGAQVDLDRDAGLREYRDDGTLRAPIRGQCPGVCQAKSRISWLDGMSSGDSALCMARTVPC